jgi:hypothetical protein
MAFFFAGWIVTHEIASASDGCKNFIPNPRLCQIGEDLLFDLAHGEKGIFIRADEDYGHPILSPDVCVQESLGIKLGQTKWDPVFVPI